MKRLKLLGLSMLVGAMIVGVPKAYGESTEPSDSEVSSEEVVEQKADDSETADLPVEEVTPAIENDAQSDEELKLLDVIYDEEKDQIIGKTEPEATVSCYSSEGSGNAGIFYADENGAFIIVNPPVGQVQVQATSKLDLRKSEQVTIEVIKKIGEPSLKITQVVYDSETKTFSAVTAPNVTVYMYMPSTGGQGFLNSNAKGEFTLKQDFEPGQEIVFTAMGAEGKTGESYRFVIPEDKADAKESTESTDSQAESDAKTATEDSGEKKGWFPHTGESQRAVIPMIGAVLLAFTGVFYRFKLKEKG